MVSPYLVSTAPDVWLTGSPALSPPVTPAPVIPPVIFRPDSAGRAGAGEVMTADLFFKGFKEIRESGVECRSGALSGDCNGEHPPRVTPGLAGATMIDTDKENTTFRQKVYFRNFCLKKDNQK